MAIIIFKIILCSSILVGIYYLFLQKEKMFRFNRFYLLFALVFSYVIPFLKINLPAVSQKENQLIFDEIQTQQLIQNTNQTSQFDWLNLILSTFVLVSIFMIIKSIVSIKKITNLKGTDIIYQKQKVKLIDKQLPPFSFWNKIYLNKSYFQNGQIDNRIFLHEKTHIVQRHSLDILFLEILKIISWFNPALYFYKKAIKDNHEFLADENIIQRNINVKDYQRLILSEIIQTQNLKLIHQFNYNNTKKRFIMMTTKKSGFENVKKTFAISAIASLSILFVQKVYASENNPEKIINKQVKTLNEGIKSDTIPQKKQLQASTKIKAEKKGRNLTVVKELKENELPIPPPPPPAREMTPAVFPEGLTALRTSFANNFDASKLNGKGMLRSNLYITIDENGITKDIRAEGSNQDFNSEAIKTMKAITQGKIWKPATEEGKPASTVFQLPITMTFQ